MQYVVVSMKTGSQTLRIKWGGGGGEEMLHIRTALQKVYLDTQASWFGQKAERKISKSTTYHEGRARPQDRCFPDANQPILKVIRYALIRMVA